MIRPAGVHTALFAVAIALCPPHAVAQPAPAPAQGLTPSAQTRDGSHDFDFEIGTWKTHLRRLTKPLSGSKTWVEYDGVSRVTKVWDGRANLVELVADGPAGHFEGLNLRLYNPEAHQWSLNFASSRGGTLGVPTIGNSCCVISHTTPNVCQFEQAFSDDGGKTWEVNWIATDTRMLQTE
jgi:hypothetical protein